MKIENVIVKNYKGTQAKATNSFRKDAVKMASNGYLPTSQSWAPDSYGCGSFIIALLLCIIVVGILVFIYMLIVKPDGVLTVTYELKHDNIKKELNTVNNSEEVECPQCAELIKKRAKVCRFCSHKIEI